MRDLMEFTFRFTRRWTSRRKLMRRRPLRFSVWLLPALLLVAARRAEAQQFTDLEPRWLRMEIPQASIGMDVEGLRENVTSRGPRQSTTTSCWCRSSDCI